ncbi:MAG: hypothetical protein JNL60_14195 [Bacteroidia bacterium]|nr:hypothetical protein [Bacteroidia bacterium]
MKLLITWTDVFNATGDFFQWIFKGMTVLGHGPNVIFWILIIGGIFYWTMRLSRYKKEASRNSTLE